MATHEPSIEELLDAATAPTPKGKAKLVGYDSVRAWLEANNIRRGQKLSINQKDLYRFYEEWALDQEQEVLSHVQWQAFMDATFSKRKLLGTHDDHSYRLHHDTAQRFLMRELPKAEHPSLWKQKHSDETRRAVVRLVVHEGLTINEAARRHGISKVTARQFLQLWQERKLVLPEETPDDEA